MFSMRNSSENKAIMVQPSLSKIVKVSRHEQVLHRPHHTSNCTVGRQEAYCNSFTKHSIASLEFTAIYLPRLVFPLLPRLQYILSKNAFIRCCMK